MFKKIIIIFILIFIISCTTTPLGRKQLAFMPDEEVDTLGVEAFSNLKQETPIETNSRVNQYVTCIAEAILQTFEDGKNWEVVVFQDDSANAFALPGEKIGVHTGMITLAENQHQLAAVIGHEVAHVLSKHGNERISQEFMVQQGMGLVQALFTNPQSQTSQLLVGALGIGAQFGVLLPYSRVHESEADELGLQLMARAGFDPRESVNLWINMSADGEQPPEFMSTHPSHETRIQDLQAQMPAALQLYNQARANGLNPRCHL
jgi:predicted Zn-dependent protease